MVLDTLRLAKALWHNLPAYGLDKLIAHAALDTTAATGHRYRRAAHDAWVAWQLLCRLMLDGDLDWDALVGAAALPEFAPAGAPYER